MLSFNKLTINDIDKLKGYFTYSTNKACDNTIGGTFIWRDFFSIEYTVFNGTLILKVEVKHHEKLTAIALPLGPDVRGSLKEIEKYCLHVGIPIAFYTVTEADLPLLRQLYGDIILHQDDSWSDYLYRADDLVNLAGRKYSGQRNHINYFKRTYGDCAFEEISGHNVGEVRDFYETLLSTAGKSYDFFAEEQSKTFEILDNYGTYGLLGGLIRANGKMAAFSIGEICNNVLYVHIEKADLRYKGSYQVMSNEFARHYVSSGIDYINREEDAGDEGLRISKKSYHPCDIIHKFIAEVKSLH
jgi:hypothetical protein